MDFRSKVRTVSLTPNPLAWLFDSSSISRIHHSRVAIVLAVEIRSDTVTGLYF